MDLLYLSSIRDKEKTKVYLDYMETIVERFNKDMLRATDLAKGETQGCSEADCDHKGGIALNACRIE